MKLSNSIQIFRKRIGLSQNELAKKIEVSNSTILRLENGEMSNPTLTILCKLSGELGVTLDELVYGDSFGGSDFHQEKIKGKVTK
ncbi:helix-turn-helix transcriptional regulator [Anaerorhabdus sp.]|uniref:helix-turn-helix transcriptional regulator n=1 Tax=Anaerorhabdus sp. TaxID=1872524 RepID=UPI002FCB4960